MSVQLLGKRELKRLGSVANDGAGAGYTSFAKGMMAKMGWAEGQGLGKDMQGRSTYVQVKKKEDNAGLGKERAQQNNVNDQWYFNAYDTALAKMDGKKKSKKSKNKREKGCEGETANGEGCMYDKMFKATGGARMGMRARASQNGKLARTEGGTDGVDGGQETDTTYAKGAILKSEKGADSANWNPVANAVVEMEKADVKKDKVRVKLVKVKLEKGVEKEERGEKKEEDAVSVKKKRNRKDVAQGEEIAVCAKMARTREKSGGKEAAKPEDQASKKAFKKIKVEGMDVVAEKARKKKRRKEG